MSATLPPSPPPAGRTARRGGPPFPAKPPQFDPLTDALIEHRSRRRDLIGGGLSLLLACFIHVVLLFGVPDDFLGVGRLIETAEAPPQREITLTFEPLTEPDPLNQRYVESNPDKPSNRPDESTNYSDRDQQAAQETDEGEIDPENNPRSEGDEPESLKVVSGDMTEPEPFAPPPGAEASPETQPTPPQTAGAPPPAPSAPEFLSPNPEVAEGQGTYLRSDPSPAEETARGEMVPAILNPEVASEQPDANVAAQQAQPPGQDSQTPRPRPRLTPQVVSGPLLQNIYRADDVGAISFASFHDDMGEYMHEVLGQIYLQWINSVRETFRTSASAAGTVEVEFWISSDGEVHRAIVRQTSAPQVNTLLARDACVARAPYRPWTEDMKNKLGDEQKVVIRFRYL